MKSTFLLLVALLLADPVAAQTHQTGDIIGGTPVIDRLDANDLPSGTVQRFWFRVTATSIAQAWYVPVIVIKGKTAGPRLLITAALHGDELNGIDVIHKLADQIQPDALAGTLVMVPGVNIPGLMRKTRSFAPSDDAAGANLNRLMPGKEGAKADAADRYAFRLWHGLFRPNADTVVDLHTQSRGSAYELFAYAGSKRALQIAEIVGADVIKLDPGEKGTLETEMLKDRVPAITLEIERPEIFQPEAVARVVSGIESLMADMKMLAPSSSAVAAKKPFIGNDLIEVRPDRGGFVRLTIALGSMVQKGDVMATVSDAFGREIESVKAPVSGRIHTIATTPLRDPGDMIARILFWSDDPKCKKGC